MRLISPFLLILCLLDNSSVRAQSQSETIVKVFEKVLKEKRDQWSKSNYNSTIYRTITFRGDTIIYKTDSAAGKSEGILFVRP